MLAGAGRGRDRVAAAWNGAFPGLYHRPIGETVRQGTRVVKDLTRRRTDLDEIPSPYLTGALDEFFAVPNLGPMIETVRGCPYSCTFGDEPPPDGGNGAGSTPEQKRHNIHYCLELLYGGEGAYRAEFSAILERSGPPPPLAGHPGVKAFVAAYRGNVIGTL